MGEKTEVKKKCVIDYERSTFDLYADRQRAPSIRNASFTIKRKEIGRRTGDLEN